jgi:phosphoribosylglycinamide formyltransferase-1
VTRTRVAVLASGRGSNMAALLDAAADPAFPAAITLVLSNRPGAAALDRARAAGVAALAIDHRPFGRDRETHERAIDAALREHGIELVCLAGYMRLFTPWLVERWAGRMLNIHPSLLPAFPGLHTHERALAAGCRLHGCTVHLVTAVTDDGPILAQAAVPILPGDTPDALAERVLVQEHRLYPAALAAMARGGAAATPDAGASLLNPLPQQPNLLPPHSGAP